MKNGHDTSTPEENAIARPVGQSGALRVAVVIPCHRVRPYIEGVIAAIPPLVERIYCVDDACPDGSGDYIRDRCPDSRLTILHHAENQGVGGAVITGYRQALEDGMEVVVKLDGDGQMDPALIPQFVSLIELGEADYCKGNRFFRPATLLGMPPARVAGNTILSFLTKISSGYWNIIDPTNGYTAIHRTALQLLRLHDIDRGYFFESDMLFRLNTIGAVVKDIPMTAVYNNEESGLTIRRVVRPFIFKNIKNSLRRVLYNYYLRDFNLASIELPLGTALLFFGFFFGAYHWINGYFEGVEATAGTVMVGALSIIVGMQMVLSALNYDVQNVPRTPLQRLFPAHGPLVLKDPVPEPQRHRSNENTQASPAKHPDAPD